MNNTILRILSSLILLPAFLFIVFQNFFYLYILLSVIWLVAVYEIKFLIKKKKIYFVFLNIIFLIFIFSLIELRRGGIVNFYFLIWIFLIIWLTDIGGFVFGKLIGGAKLTKWSPNKTLSGFFGSIIFAQFAFFLPYFQLNLQYSFKFFLIQLLITLSAVCGDIFFSYIKRTNNLKDFSYIIPGHGGLLDRIDGMIFAIIFSNFLKFLNVY